MLVACGGATNDTDDGDAKTENGKSGLVCTAIVPGQDVCSLDVEPRALRTIEGVTAYAKLAFDMRSGVDDACVAGLADLGLTRTPNEPSCTTLANAISGKTDRLQVVIEQPSCTKVPAPSCAGPNAAARNVCTGGRAVATAPADATDSERAIAEMITRRYDAIVRTKPALEDVSELVGSIAGQIAEVPAECAPTVTGLVTRANESVTEATTQSTAALTVLPVR
jgi:hypothetical protein